MEQPQPGGAPNPYETPTPPLGVAPASTGIPAPPPTAPAPPTPPAAPVQSSLVSQSGEQCPACGTHLAADQRYCLECGHRRGDPRLPFMDAVVFMDAAQRPHQAPPPPPSGKRPRMSANASLIAGVGTLLLAMGIGVLIGHSGEHGSSTADATPQIIKVGGGGGETASAATPGGSTSKSKGGSGKAKKTAKSSTEAGSSGTSEAAEKILKPAGNVKLPPPTVQKGGKCESGAAGCENGEFTGNFFGE